MEEDSKMNIKGQIEKFEIMGILSNPSVRSYRIGLVGYIEDSQVEEVYNLIRKLQMTGTEVTVTQGCTENYESLNTVTFLIGEIRKGLPMLVSPEEAAEWSEEG